MEVKWIFVAWPIGFLLTLLFYYDHVYATPILLGTKVVADWHQQNQSSVAAQARQFPLKKPGGFHWDFFLLGCTSFIAGIIDIPLPNGLVPQAPVHTDSLTNYKSVLKIIKKEDGGEIRQQEIVAESVAEQRVSHFLMGLAIIATMTGPILIVLNLIPRALFGGVFFVVGWGGLEGNGIMAKIIYLIREPRFIQPDEPLLQIPRKRVAFYLFWQIFGITATVGVSQTIAAIGMSSNPKSTLCLNIGSLIRLPCPHHRPHPPSLEGPPNDLHRQRTSHHGRTNRRQRSCTSQYGRETTDAKRQGRRRWRNG